MTRLKPILPALASSTLLLSSSLGAQGMTCLRIQESDLVEEWRYAPSETAPAEQLLALPEWAARSASGDTYVLDRPQHRILRLDAAGRFRGAFGGRGGAPGQFMNPVGVRTTSTGEVAVLDLGPNRVNFLSPEGELKRTLRLGVQVYQARDFLVLSDGRVAVSGSAAGSNHLVHVFRADGSYEAGLSSLRMDLDEPVLRERFSEAALAELPGGRLAVAHRTPFRLQVFRDTRLLADRTDPRIVPDYVAQAAQRDGTGWRFNWRHPKLTTLLPLDGGCFLVGVQVPPDSERATPSDFRTHLYVLNAAGSVVSHTQLSRFFWGTQVWRDRDGVRLLGLGLDRETDLLYPVQYRLRSSVVSPSSPSARSARSIQRN